MNVGDYDGDKVIVIWQPEVVQHFTNAEPCPPPDDLNDAFVQAKEKVSDFLIRTAVDDPEQRIREVQRTFILNPICLRMETGRYSNMHENSAYMYGYSDPKTTRLGHMYVYFDNVRV